MTDRNTKERQIAAEITETTAAMLEEAPNPAEQPQQCDAKTNLTEKTNETVRETVRETVQREELKDQQRSLPQVDEAILKNTKLLQVQPPPDFTILIEDENPDTNTNSLDFGNPWQSIQPQKVKLNKYVDLAYVSEADLKQVIRHLHNIQTKQQKKFRKIIAEMQKEGSGSDLSKYSSKITDNKGGYNFNILFLDFSRYLKSCFHPPTRRILQVADIVYPQGVLMQWAFRSLAAKVEAEGQTAQAKQNYQFCDRFDFTIGLLSDLDEYHCSVSLIGGNMTLLNKVENIFNISFHNIKVLGCYTSGYRKGKRINEIRTVINKSAPTILLVTKNACIQDFIDGKDGERKIKAFIVLDYPEALKDFSSKHRRRKYAILKILQPISYLIFPWKWPKLFCILIFLLKISFLTLSKR